MKKILALVGCVLSFSCFATTTVPAEFINAPNCGQAAHDAQFCENFRVQAKCYCDEVLHRSCPSDMNVLYAILLETGRGDLVKACKYQQQFTKLDWQICVADWNFYRIERVPRCQ